MFLCDALFIIQPLYKYEFSIAIIYENMIWFEIYTGITCTLPQPPSNAHFEDEKSTYQTGETVRVACDYSGRTATWECDIYTGKWNTESIQCPTDPGTSSPPVLETSSGTIICNFHFASLPLQIVKCVFFIYTQRTIEFKWCLQQMNVISFMIEIASIWSH